MSCLCRSLTHSTEAKRWASPWRCTSKCWRSLFDQDSSSSLMKHSRGAFGLSFLIYVIRANMHREYEGFTAILVMDYQPQYMSYPSCLPCINIQLGHFLQEKKGKVLTTVSWLYFRKSSQRPLPSSELLHRVWLYNIRGFNAVIKWNERFLVTNDLISQIHSLRLKHSCCTSSFSETKHFACTVLPMCTNSIDLVILCI